MLKQLTYYTLLTYILFIILAQFMLKGNKWSFVVCKSKLGKNRGWYTGE